MAQKQPGARAMSDRAPRMVTDMVHVATATGAPHAPPDDLARQATSGAHRPWPLGWLRSPNLAPGLSRRSRLPRFARSRAEAQGSARSPATQPPYRPRRAPSRTSMVGRAASVL